MTDIEKLHGKVDAPQQTGQMSILTGSAPVSTMRNYAAEVTAYTRGMGHLFCTLKGYEPCWNEEEVVAASGYDPDRDLMNPSGSVFCAHGAGFVVNWDEVPDYMHLESVLEEAAEEEEEPTFAAQEISGEDDWIDPEEVDRILDQTFNANKHAKSPMKRGIKKRKTTIQPVYRSFEKPKAPVDEYLLVDGYNVIFAWEDLSELAQTNLDGARGKLLDILCNYQAVKKCNLIAVFDAYRIKGHQTEILDYYNIHVVFTKEAETADQYIEKFAHENGRKYHVTVATSDGVEQVIIRGQGCKLLSARELQGEIRMADAQSTSAFQESRSRETGKEKTYLLDAMNPDERGKLEKK
jgi:predicted RNA-binding protein with PIN domain